MTTRQLFTLASLALLLLAAATGCTDDHSDANEPVHTGLPVDFASIRIAASANGGSGAGSMPTTDAGGFYPGDIIHARLVHNTTMQKAVLTNIGTAGTPKWEADTPVYWQSTTTGHTLTLNRGSEGEFTLPDDMNATTSVSATGSGAPGSGATTITNYTLHDRLFYTRTDLLPGTPIACELEHRMAQIVVTLTRAEGSKLPTDDDLRAARVSMELPFEGYFDSTTGDVTQRNTGTAGTGSKKTVKFLKGDELAGVHSHFAVALPGDTHTKVITITIPTESSSTGNEQKYQYTASQAITLEAGSSRVFHLSVGSRVSAISITTKDWQPIEQGLGVSEGYGIEVTPGKLEGLLSKVPADCKHIRVSGVLDYRDYWALRTFLDGLYSPVSLEIEITGGSRNITGRAFESCTKLGAVTLKGITEIYDYAFKNSSLTSIILPEGLTYIGYDAFRSCLGLKSITLPNSVTELGINAFADCTNLASVSLSEGLEKIGDSAFGNCTSLKSITLPSSVTTWGTGIFAGSGLTSIVLPEGMTEIPYATFQDCGSLQTITLHSKITAVGEDAFFRSGLTSIILPEKLTTIGENAFRDCAKLASIILPEKLTTIGERAFYECTKLQKVAAYKSPDIKVGTEAFFDTPTDKLLFDYGISSEGSINGSILNTDWKTIYYNYQGSGDKLAPSSYSSSKQLTP